MNARSVFSSLSLFLVLNVKKFQKSFHINNDPILKLTDPKSKDIIPIHQVFRSVFLRLTLKAMDEKVRLNVEEKIKKILISELEIKPNLLANCDSNTPLLGRGIGLDSVETLTLVAGIEKEFDIQIDDEDLTVGLFKSLGTLTDYVLQRVRI